MATRRGVVYELDADERKAIDGFRRAIGKARQMEAAVSSGSAKMTRGYGRQGRELANIERAFGRIQRLGSRFLGGLGVAGGVAGGAVFLRKIVGELQAQAKLQQTFEGEVTGLLSLGTNIDNIKAVKQEVLDISNAFRLPRSEAAAFLFNLQSNAANLSEEIRGGIKKESLELAKVTGATLPTSVNLLSKAWQAYGGDLKDVNDLQNKLFLTAELGAITFEKLGQFAPDVFQTAKVLGFSFEETLGSIVVATQKLGRTEKALTGVRNVFSRLGEAPEKLEALGFDFELTGNLVEDLKALEAIPGQILKKIFGEEAVATIGALKSGVEDLIEVIEKLRKVEGDLAADRAKGRLKDPAFVKTLSIGVLKKLNENFALEGGKTKGALNLTEELQQATLGVRMHLPQQVQLLAPIIGAADVVMEKIEEGTVALLTGEKFKDRLTGFQMIGANIQLNRLRRQGEKAEAEAILKSLPPAQDFTPTRLGAALLENRRQVRAVFGETPRTLLADTVERSRSRLEATISRAEMVERRAGAEPRSDELNTKIEALTSVLERNVAALEASRPRGARGRVMERRIDSASAFSEVRESG